MGGARAKEGERWPERAKEVTKICGSHFGKAPVGCAKWEVERGPPCRVMRAPGREGCWGWYWQGHRWSFLTPWRSRGCGAQGGGVHAGVREREERVAGGPGGSQAVPGERGGGREKVTGRREERVQDGETRGWDGVVVL